MNSDTLTCPQCHKEKKNVTQWGLCYDCIRTNQERIDDVEFNRGSSLASAEGRRRFREHGDLSE